MNTDPRLVILAAGASERLGEPKALARIGTRSVLEHLVGAWPGPEPALVLTGRHAREIEAQLPGGAAALEHPNWALGRTGVLAAAAAAEPGRDFLVAPADCPLIPRSIFAALLRRWRTLGCPSHGYLSPFVATEPGKRRFGHPLVIGKDLLKQLHNWSPDRPLRDLRALAKPLEGLRVQESSILDDLDSPQDLADLRRRVTERPSGRPGFEPK